MRRLCVTPGCASTTTRGGRCGECQRVYERSIERAGRELYSTKRWQIARRKQLFPDTLCELQYEGCVGLANEVHHRVPLRDGGDPFAPSNLMSACKPCHSVETRLEQIRRWNER